MKCHYEARRIPRQDIELKVALCGKRNDDSPNLYRTRRASKVTCKRCRAILDTEGT